ncbi:MAG: YihY/virulence factor BrkB family protein [Hyphomicrobiales bacterium]|nr:YihY/virulence factor BrkB family protein [Hyphomicrobiales bacterium]
MTNAIAESASSEQQLPPTGSARGAGANSPAQIPIKGWKDILWRVYDELGEDRVLLIAAGVTFYFLLAFVPGLSALISFYGLFFDSSTMLDHLTFLQGIVPGGGLEIIRDQLQRITGNSNTTLGLATIVSTGIALWSANAGIKGLFEAMNVAYGEREKRSFITLNLITLSFTVSTIAAMIAFMGVMIALPQALAYLWIPEATKWLIKGLSFAVMFIMFAAGVAAIYRWGPSRNEASWKWITPGTLLSVIVAVIVSILFSWYVSNFGSYNATYGSLGALIGFVTWIWIMTIILVVGAELNAETEQQTVKGAADATNEPRGAYDIAGNKDNPAIASVAAVRDRQQAAPPDARQSAGSRISLGRLAIAIPAAALVYWFSRKQKKATGQAKTPDT